jgi:DNA polymerase-3 subunit epsilon
LLLDVYLAMTGGQATLSLEQEEEGGRAAAMLSILGEDNRAPLKVILPSAEELESHRDRLDAIDGDSGGRCLWRAGEDVAD